eukprot:snap_masked-scaffold425_size175135-processed-gene-0.34 protein:Tk05835 transcript:snap_masked-scaffold425_size175135-processed-gene-0.34-mRNA-1 annotation:"mevalonate kinase isoform x1"
MSRRAFRPIHVSAPSKLILHGEHAVVYGRTALAASLNMRTSMTLQPRPGGVKVNFPDIDILREWTLADIRDGLFPQRPERFGRQAVDPVYLEAIHDFLGVTQDDLAHASLVCFFYLFSVICDDVVGMDISVHSEIPIGAGLGSSAALSVCLAGGLLRIRQGDQDPTDPDLDQISGLALLSEKILHGSPSGVDNTVSTFGGVIQFANGVVQMPEGVPQLRILLVNTQVQRQTKDLVDRVRQQFIEHPTIIRPIFEAIDAISRECLATLQAIGHAGQRPEHFHTLGRLVDYNQSLLATLGVSHPALASICAIAHERGLHAKLTGAGGGGFAFVLIPPHVNEKNVLLARDQFEERGYGCYETQMGVPGVSIEWLTPENDS